MSGPVAEGTEEMRFRLLRQSREALLFAPQLPDMECGLARVRSSNRAECAPEQLCGGYLDEILKMKSWRRSMQVKCTSSQMK